MTFSNGEFSAASNFSYSLASSSLDSHSAKAAHPPEFSFVLEVLVFEVLEEFAVCFVHPANNIILNRNASRLFI